MGGPSRESYQAAAKARCRRLAAMRTRDGVVALAEWRIAARAARWIEATFGTAPSFLGVRIGLAKEVGFELHIHLLQEDEQLRMCLPSSVDDVPLVVHVRNSGQTLGRG